MKQTYTNRTSLGLVFVFRIDPCLAYTNRTSLGPVFVFRIDKSLAYTREFNKDFLHCDFM